MLVIIGGSGMLFEASRTLVEKHAGAALLCARRASRYQPILAAHRHARFFRFDFSAPEDYARLCQRLDGEDSALTFLAWIHSPYYVYFNDLLDTLGEKAGQVYLVKGSHSHPLPPVWSDWQNMTVIPLGKHPTENRWLTDKEICQQVLAAMDGRQAEKRRAKRRLK